MKLEPYACSHVALVSQNSLGVWHCVLVYAVIMAARVVCGSTSMLSVWLPLFGCNLLSNITLHNNNIWSHDLNMHEFATESC